MQFWPTNLEEWLGVIIQVSAITGAIYTFLSASINSKIKKETKKCMDKLEKEEEHRKLADTRIEEKLRENNDTIHEALGKIGLIDIRIQEYDRAMRQEVHDLEIAITKGLGDIRVEIEKARR